MKKEPNESQQNTMQEIQCVIDWISATSHRAKASNQTWINVVYNYFADDKWSETRASNGYALAWENDIGIKQMVNLDRQDMGTHIIYSGKTLRKIEKMTQHTPMNILEYHIAHQDKLTRVDVAIDCHNFNLDIIKLAEDFRQGKKVSRARTATLVNDVTGSGHTLYIGSKVKRKKLLRIYDKAAEMKVEGDWKRIELQVMGDIPIKQMVNIMQDGSRTLEEKFKGIIKGYCDFTEDSTWKQIMDCDSIKIGSIPIEKGDTRAWILKQCVPAIVKECRLDATFWAQLQMAFISEMNEENDV